MNVARSTKLPGGGYDLFAREMQLYVESGTNEILHTWYNPFIEENVTGEMILYS